LVTPQGNINDGVAIAKYMADGHAINGANHEERARVDQWIWWCITTAFGDQRKAIGAVYGQLEVLQAEYNESMNKIKANAKTLNGVLNGKQWLVGDNVTLADIMVACTFVSAQQTILDGGFRKAMPHYSAWFERVMALPEVIAVMGNVKSCAKAVKPQIKAEEKKAAPKQQAAPKKKDDDDEEAPKKKEKTGLDALPPTPFDLYNFKTFFVNEADRYGSAVDEFLKQFDKEGWSMWFMHYEMYKGEGEKLYHTENLADGFLQRWDAFRKYSFGRMCILGTEEKQEIMGVFMWRGLDIPQECHEHPQFEYYKTRKMDITKDEDLKLLREFWGSKEGGQAAGFPILTCKWQK